MRPVVPKLRFFESAGPTPPRIDGFFALMTFCYCKKPTAHAHGRLFSRENPNEKASVRMRGGCYGNELLFVATNQERLRMTVTVRISGRESIQPPLLAAISCRSPVQFN